MSSISSIFAPIYEWLTYNSQFNLVFQELFNGNGYALLGLSLLFVPLLLFIPYYWDARLPWGNPYRKKWTWYVWLVVTAVIVGAASYGIVYNAIFSSGNIALQDALSNPSTGYQDFANGLIVKLAMINALYSLLVSFLWSLLLKLFSVLHIHIPF